MTAERLYAALLLLYPKAFRNEYGHAMREAFCDLRAATSLSPPSFWQFVIIDAVCSAARAHLDECRTGSWRFTLRWLATCGLGLAATVLVANLVAWSFSYFYHPYFEGVTVSPWRYGACLGLVLGGTIGIAQRFLLRRDRCHARSWVLGSAVALPIAALACGTVVQRTVMGMNAVAAHPYADALTVVMVGLRQKNWTDVIVEFGAMAVSGLIAGRIAERLAERRDAYQAAN